MTPTLAIAWREFASFYRLPIGWVVTSLYLLLTGVVFSTQIRPGDPASMRSFFDLSVWLLLFVAPAISMRLLAEERRSGSLELLMTAPVSDWKVVFGKYLGSVGFLLAMIAPTLLYAALLESLADPDYGPILAGYLGMILLGGLYLAIGLFASTLTSNQIVAFLGTLFFLLLLSLLTVRGAEYVAAPFDEALYALSVQLRMSDFAKGVIDTAHVVFFLAATFWFLVLAVLSLEFQRWR